MPSNTSYVNTRQTSRTPQAISGVEVPGQRQRLTVKQFQQWRIKVAEKQQKENEAMMKEITGSDKEKKGGQQPGQPDQDKDQDEDQDSGQEKEEGEGEKEPAQPGNLETKPPPQQGVPQNPAGGFAEPRKAKAKKPTPIKAKRKWR